MAAASTLVDRLEGRLFVEEGRLCLILEADPVSGMAQVSRCVDSERQVFPMPIPDVCSRLASNIDLDSLGKEGKTDRTVEKDDGWYACAREGEIGPFETKKQAAKALEDHILEHQATTSKYR
jgi:hypothetical protein